MKVCDWADHDADGGKRYRHYKLQQTASPLTFEERWDCWKCALINLFVWNAVFGMGLAYPIWLARAPPAEWVCRRSSRNSSSPSPSSLTCGFTVLTG